MITSFLLRAWLLVVTMLLIVSLFLAVRRHYRYLAKRLSIQDLVPRWLYA